MQLFYCPEISLKNYNLSEEESKHCSRVLRKRKGDQIDITDGKGTFYSAELSEVSPKKCTFNILSSQTFKRSGYSIHIAIAPTKNIDRIEWFIEKSTELGIDKITFLKTAHSERNKINIDRIRKKTISAMKQSLQPFATKVMDMSSISDFLKTVDESHRYIAHLDEEGGQFLATKAAKDQNYVIMIGPEGGFSSAEIELCKKSNFESVTLGKSRLRTETAGFVACTILNMINYS